MKFITDNLKKVGIVNSILIISAVVLRLINFTEAPPLIIIDQIVCIIALCFGLVYSFNGYNKEAANYYKVFMYLYVFSCLLSLVSPIVYRGFENILIIIVNFAILVCTCLLAFVKDFGKDKSTTVACILIILNVIKLINDLLRGLFVTFHFAGYTGLVQAIVACVLVSHKYIDKETRGTK